MLDRTPKDPTIWMPHQASDESYIQRFCAITCVIYICSAAFEGPIRWSLQKIEAQESIYIRDIFLVVATTIWSITHTYRTNRINQIQFAAFFALLLHLCVGALNTQSFYAPLLGLKIYLPMLFGMCIGQNNKNTKIALTVICAVWPIIILSLILQNSGINFPWIGISYDTIFGQTETSKEWWSEEQQRLSGTTRASYNAASFISAGSITILLFYKHKIMRAAAFLIGLYAIFLTTNKGFLAAYILTSSLIIFSENINSKNFLKISAWLLAIATLSATIIVILVEPRASANAGIPSSLLSLWDRFTNTWPAALQHITNPLHATIGTGLGTIGTAQLKTTGIPSYGDSIYVYHYTAMGIPGIVYLLLALNTVVSRFSSEAKAKTLQFLTISLFSFGFTANVVEEPLSSIIIGIAISYSLKKNGYN